MSGPSGWWSKDDSEEILLQEVWKGVGVLRVMYGADVIGRNENKTYKLEVRQTKVVRTAINTTKCAAVESLIGVIGWSTLKEKQMRTVLICTRQKWLEGLRLPQNL